MEETRLLMMLVEQEGEVVDEHEVDANGTVVNFKVYNWKEDIYCDVLLDGESVLFQKLERKKEIAK